MNVNPRFRYYVAFMLVLLLALLLRIPTPPADASEHIELAHATPASVGSTYARP